MQGMGVKGGVGEGGMPHFLGCELKGLIAYFDCCKGLQVCSLTVFKI